MIIISRYLPHHIPTELWYIICEFLPLHILRKFNISNRALYNYIKKRYCPNLLYNFGTNYTVNILRKLISLTKHFTIITLINFYQNDNCKFYFINIENNLKCEKTLFTTQHLTYYLARRNYDNGKCIHESLNTSCTGSCYVNVCSSYYASCIEEGASLNLTCDITYDKNKYRQVDIKYYNFVLENIDVKQIFDNVTIVNNKILSFFIKNKIKFYIMSKTIL